MKMKDYETPEIDVVRFYTSDVITTSGLNSGGGDGSGGDWGDLFDSD